MVKHSKKLSKSRGLQQDPRGVKLNHKKRPRSTSGDSDGSVAPNGSQATNSNSTATSQVVNIVPVVVQWLETRRKSVPSALKSNTVSIDINAILKLLPDLRERERRALTRKVEKALKNDGSNIHELQGSDNEYGSDDDLHKSHDLSDNWPSTVEFSNNYRWDSSVPKEIKDEYCPADGGRERVNRLSRRVYFKRIKDPNHPAFGEYGLFCALPNGAPPGTWLLDYVGHVTLGKDQDKQSDYCSDFGEKSEFACDANSFGNEARFLNDFRNTGKHPNVEFNFRRDKHGELRQGVYVKLAKDSKIAGFDGVNQHDELLVSYGKQQLCIVNQKPNQLLSSLTFASGKTDSQ